jgi:hypothetical protein
MKIISWEKDAYKKLFGRESPHDLMVAWVVYDGGSEGKMYVHRARMNVIIFEQEHIGKIMTQKDFEDYRELIHAESEVDRSYEED